MKRQEAAKFVFLRRRAEQLYQEGLTACAARLLKGVDEAQARLFHGSLEKKPESDGAADGEAQGEMVVSTHLR